jgi:hypothetical protein
MPGFGPILGASLLVDAGDLAAFPTAECLICRRELNGSRPLMGSGPDPGGDDRYGRCAGCAD